VKPVAPNRRAAAAASSARNAVVLEEGGSLAIVGGRLNVAENEAVRQGLLHEDLGPARQTARAQEKEGAQILLLKIGVAGLDEAETTRKILETLSPTTRSSFLIDAERVETIGQTLRFYPGRLLVRVSGSDPAAILPVVAKYGAIPVLPFPADGKREAIRKVVADARSCGFTKEEIVMDCTPRAQNPEALRAALGMISWCGKILHCRTLLDITDIGEGLPEPEGVALLGRQTLPSGTGMAVAKPVAGRVLSVFAPMVGPP